GAGHGVRTRDLRLGNTKRSEALTNVYLQNGTNRGTELLEAVARQDGEAAHGLAVQLAREVLSSKPVVLAGQVLAGGEHALAAAVELAELVLSAAAGLGDQSARAVPPDPAGLTRVGA
ncbi:MAG: hypothetical protein M3O50_18305, partial [Myxococcota bacterium]|nr:hypothetical protein [Myxococcota bacterium]